MLGKLVPVLLVCIGVSGGLGAGLALRPAADDNAAPAPTPEREADPAKADGEDKAQEGQDKSRDYVKLNNQFVVPIVGDKRVESMVVLSLSIEVATGQAQIVYSREPKLRDQFLQVLFDHANVGGFDGAFTDANTLGGLRMALTEVAQSVIGDPVTGVLITEIARQDM